jgi:hypothetical protein
VRWCLIAVAVAAAGALPAQDSGANSPSELQNTAAKRTTEWTTLETNLELRLARLLPCDARVRGAIEEVSRAADARTVARTSYWTTISLKSKTQVESIRGLLAEEEGRAGDWSKDRADAQVDVATTVALAASLGPGIRQLPALAVPQKGLEAVAQMYRVLEAQSEERANNVGQLVSELRELLKASQARQAAIEDQLVAIGTEGQLWSAYYTARQARAQVECSITSPAQAPLRPAPLPPRKTP